VKGRWLSFCALSVLGVAASGAWTQDVDAVDQQALNQHVDHRVSPVYPPIAKAAHIQGTVVFELRIGISGKIESMKVVSGPAMLQQAAIDCLKQWTFHPFEKDGALVSATGQMPIIFALSDYHPGSNDEQIAAMYFPLSDRCRQAVSTKGDLSGAESVCNQAGETAEQFGPGVRFIEKRSAFVYAATACANNRDLVKALAWAAKAVDVVKLGHDDNSGSNAAYSTKGIIEGMMGDLTAADGDLTVAEDFGRKAVAWAEQEKFEHGDSYKQSLVRDFRFHAQILQAMSRSKDAQEKLGEAAKYE
jgi:TonB family protein